MRLSLLFAFVALVLAPLLHANATPAASGPAPQLRLHRATFDAQAPAASALTPRPAPMRLFSSMGRLRPPITLRWSALA